MSGLRHPGDGLRRDIIRVDQVSGLPNYVKGVLGSRRANVLDIADWDATGSNDMATGYQALINQAATAGVPVDMPKGRALLGSTISLPGGHVFQGYNYGGIFADPAQASSFFIAHSGKGFIRSGGNGSPVAITNQVTVRDQPAPSGPSWEPNDHDFDYYFADISDFKMSRILTLNATRGIYFNGNRNSISEWGGQCFKVGLQIDWSYDTCHISDVHLWPFWNHHQTIRENMQSALRAFKLGRVDNSFFSKIFTIWHQYGFFIDRFAGDGPNKPAGTASKLNISQADIDIGGVAYYVAPDADGHTATFNGVSAQGPDGSGGGPLLHIAGPNTVIMGDFAASDVDNNLVRLEATSAGSQVAILLKGNNWNRDGAGFPAVEVVPGGGHVDILPGYVLTNGNGGAAGSGDITFWNEPGSTSAATGPGGAGYVPYDPDYTPDGTAAFAIKRIDTYNEKQAEAGVSLSLYATGDGVTPAYSALATLLANEQHIIIPDGSFLVNSDEPLILLDNQTITGVGGELLITSSPASSALFLADGVNNVTLRGLRARLTSGGKYFFYGRDTRGITIENNMFGRPDALWLGLPFAFFAKGCEDVIATGNRIYGGQAGFATGGDPLLGLGTDDGTVRNVLIKNNLIYRTTTEGVDINWDTDGFSVINNWMIECGTRGEASNQILDIGGGLTAAFTASIAGTTLTITAIVPASGGQSKDTIAIGDILYFGGLPAGIDITIEEQLTGSAGGTGTYRLSQAPGDAASATMRVWSTICRNGIVADNFITTYDTGGNTNPAYRIPNSGIEVKGGSRNVTVARNTIIGSRKAGSFALKYSSGYDCDMADNEARGFAIGGYSIGTCVRAHMRRNRFSDVTQIGLYTTFGSDMRYTDGDYSGNIIAGVAATESALMLRSADGCDISRTVVKGGFTSSSSGLGRGIRVDSECSSIRAENVDITGCNINAAISAPNCFLSGKLSKAITYNLDAAAADLAIGDIQAIDGVAGGGGQYQVRFQSSCDRLRILGTITVDDTRATKLARGIQFLGGTDIFIGNLNVLRYLTTAVAGMGSLVNVRGSVAAHGVYNPAYFGGLPGGRTGDAAADLVRATANRTVIANVISQMKVASLAGRPTALEFTDDFVIDAATYAGSSTPSVGVSAVGGAHYLGSGVWSRHAIVFDGMTNFRIVGKGGKLIRLENEAANITGGNAQYHSTILIARCSDFQIEGVLEGDGYQQDVTRTSGNFVDISYGCTNFDISGTIRNHKGTNALVIGFNRASGFTPTASGLTGYDLLQPCVGWTVNSVVAFDGEHAMLVNVADQWGIGTITHRHKPYTYGGVAQDGYIQRTLYLLGCGNGHVGRVRSYDTHKVGVLLTAYDARRCYKNLDVSIDDIFVQAPLAQDGDYYIGLCFNDQNGVFDGTTELRTIAVKVGKLTTRGVKNGVFVLDTGTLGTTTAIVKAHFDEVDIEATANGFSLAPYGQVSDIAIGKGTIKVRSDAAYSATSVPVSGQQITSTYQATLGASATAFNKDIRIGDVLVTSGNRTCVLSMIDGMSVGKSVFRYVADGAVTSPVTTRIAINWCKGHGSYDYNTDDGSVADQSNVLKYAPSPVRGVFRRTGTLADPGSLAAGASVNTGSLTVNGARVGMPVTVTLGSNPTGIQVRATVTADNTVVITTSNISSSSQSPGALTYYLDVIATLAAGT